MKSKKIVSIVLTMCLLVSMLTVSMFSSSAEDVLSLGFYSKFAANQLYSRGLSAAGAIITKIGEISGNKEVKEDTSYINDYKIVITDILRPKYRQLIPIR